MKRTPAPAARAMFAFLLAGSTQAQSLDRQAFFLVAAWRPLLRP